MCIRDRPGGCQSRVNTWYWNLGSKLLITGTIVSPPVTSRAPPGKKSFCASTTMMASFATAISTVQHLLAHQHYRKQMYPIRRMLLGWRCPSSLSHDFTVRGEVGVENLRHLYLALIRLEILHDGDDGPPQGDHRAVERMGEIGGARLALGSGLETSRLVVCAVGAAGYLSVFSLGGYPGFQVIFLVGGGSSVTCCDIHCAVGNAQVPQDLFFYAAHELMLLCGAVRVAEAAHLHLVELVDSEHPARVSPRCTGLAAEAAGVPYIAQGQLILREYLFNMQGRERYLRRTHQVKVV